MTSIGFDVRAPPKPATKLALKVKSNLHNSKPY